MSIGLFGDWGSGKSFFMGKIQESVSGLREERKRRREEAAKASADAQGRRVDPFVTNVVQLRFNAWSYADGDVWASLTAEFFDQLRVGGFDGRDGATFGRLVELVSHDIQSAEGTLAESTKTADAKKKEAEDQEKKIAELERRKADLEATVLGTVANEILKGMLAKPDAGKPANPVRAAIDKSGEAIGRPNLADNLEGLRSEVEAAQDVPGKIALILRSVAHGGWQRLAFAASAVALAALAISVGNWGAADYWAASLTRFAATLGSLGMAIKVLRDGYLRVKPLLDVTDRFFEKLKTEQEKLEAELKLADQNLAVARKAEAEARIMAAKATERLTLLPGSATASSKATLLRYFLFDTEETRGFEKTLGVVSRARRAFETLDAIVRDYRDFRTLRDADVESRRGGDPLSDEEAARLKRLAPKYAGIDADVDSEIPDRVVLYIDDLDRCRTDQVVKVLEAVHLLLAFESFVVVVGVDVRWTSAALANYYSGQLALDPAAAGHRQATPDDYLEKIFQIPFWLRPISLDPLDGTLSRLVRNVAGEPEPEIVLEKLGDAAEAIEAVGGEPNQVFDKVVTLDVPNLDLAEPPEEPPAVSPADILWTAAEERELVLTARELAAFEAVGPLIARSPRAVKRFVNSYRIIRNRYRGAGLDAFTLDSSDAPFAAVALLLAVEVGLGRVSRDCLLSVLSGQSQSPGEPSGNSEGPGPSGTERFEMARSQLAAAGRQPSTGRLAEYMPLVGRFSFHGPVRVISSPR